MHRLAAHTRLIALLLVALMVAGAGASLLGAFRGVDPNSAIATGWREVEVSVPEQGALTPLTTDAGLPVSGTYVLNFWASFCEPCKEEMPLLERLDSEGVVPVVGVSRDVREELALAEIDNRRVTYPNLLDSSGDFMRQFSSVLPVNYLPATLVISDGVIRWVHVGPFDDYPELLSELRPRLG